MNDLNFDNIISKLKITEEINPECKEFNILTITSGFNFCDNIDILNIYNRIEINEKLLYVSINDKDIRGYKKIKKVNKASKYELKKDKRKNNKGKSFNSQLSLGYKCDIKEHNHSNPISIKIFINGKMQITGCKNKEEIIRIYNYIIKKINEIPSVFKDNFGNTFKYNMYQNLTKNIVIKYDMILVKIDVNYDINQYRFSNYIDNNYKDINCLYNPNISTNCQLYLNNFSYKKNDGEDFIPVCMIYNNSITFIISNYNIISKIYSYLKNILIKGYLEIRDYDYILD
jgi:TATA-box binding protein (TBP) (component of TFIID and TFIIIB)